MARQYLTTRRVQDAKKLFADLLERRPDDVGILLGLAEVATAARNLAGSDGIYQPCPHRRT
jgi:thioredoxin-like negative regulator of GroEL